jgi:proline dehydrogenase
VTAGAGSSSSGSGSGPRRFGKFGLTLAVAPLALVAGGAYLLRPDEPTPDASNITTTRTADLLRAYGVYAICGVPAVVDAAPTLLHAFTHSPIPGLKTLTEFVVRHTFFDQFVAGENLPQCVAAMHDMAARGMGGVLNYSAEAEHSDGLPAERRASEARNFEECRNAIEALGEFERQHIAAGGAPGTSSFAIKLVSKRMWQN